MNWLYKLSLTWEELCAIKAQLSTDAVFPAEISALEKINKLHEEASLERKKVEDCDHDFKDYFDGRHCERCGCPE